MTISPLCLLPSKHFTLPLLTCCSSLCCQSPCQPLSQAVSAHCGRRGSLRWAPQTPTGCGVGTGSAEGSIHAYAVLEQGFCCNLSQGFLQEYTWSNFGVKFIRICSQRRSQEWAQSLWTTWVIQIQSFKMPLQIFHHWF